MFRFNNWLLIFGLLIFAVALSGCRSRSGGADNFTIALDAKLDRIDSLAAISINANVERVSSLMYNPLVKKNERFEYVGDLAKEINTSFDGATVTFVLRDNVKFHNGKDLTAADAKYTLDTLIKIGGAAKALAFFETVNNQPTAMIAETSAPDAKTLVIKLARPALKNNLLANLVAIPIVPENAKIEFAPNETYTPPPGTGAYQFVAFDQVNGAVELKAHENYWEGAPNIKTVRVKTVADANALQAELKSNRVQLAPLPSNLSPDTLKSLEADLNLTVKQFPGANIQYLSFNTSQAPLDNPKLRQAIAYAINREQLINELLLNQAKLAHSILPEESWAYSAPVKYQHDAARAAQLLDEAGLKPGANGMRLAQPIKFKIRAGNAASNQYAQVIQNQLRAAGIPVEIETAEPNVVTSQLIQGQYQMTMAQYIGGNQDPIFLRDLFASSQIGISNRTRYNNPEFDKIIGQAVNEPDRERARQLYIQAQEIVSRDVPLLPLWYPANIVVARGNVGNIQVSGGGDWTFVRNLTVSN